MFQTLMISFREGLEAFLIIAISLIYLAQTNRRDLIPAVYSGVGVAVPAGRGVAVRFSIDRYRTDEFEKNN